MALCSQDARVASGVNTHTHASKQTDRRTDGQSERQKRCCSLVKKMPIISVDYSMMIQWVSWQRMKAICIGLCACELANVVFAPLLLVASFAYRANAYIAHLNHARCNICAMSCWPLATICTQKRNFFSSFVQSQCNERADDRSVRLYFLFSFH